MTVAMETGTGMQGKEGPIAPIEDQRFSTCGRCGGFMVNDLSIGLRDGRETRNLVVKRCVQCGDIVDPVILHNRQLRRESIRFQPGVRVLAGAREVESLD